jgi:hypothetical protein
MRRAGEPLDYVVRGRSSPSKASPTHEPPIQHRSLRHPGRHPERWPHPAGIGDPIHPGRPRWPTAWDAVEMTNHPPTRPRGQTRGMPARIPCCCATRRARFAMPEPLISCVVKPSTGLERRTPDWYQPAPIRGRHGDRRRSCWSRSGEGGGRRHRAHGSTTITRWGRRDRHQAARSRLGVAELNGSVSSRPEHDGAGAMAHGPTGAVVIQCTGSVRGERRAPWSRADTIGIRAPCRRGSLPGR